MLDQDDTRICVHCGNEFKPRRKNQTKYCSRQCKDRAHSAQQRLREKPVCSEKGCDRPSKHPSLKTPLCSMHDARKRKTGEVGSSDSVYGKRFGKWPCEVSGCEGKYYAKGYCRLHYNRLQRTGSLGAIGRTKREDGQGTVAIVKGYRQFRWFKDGERRAISEHKMVIEGVLGRPLYFFERVHHKNGIRHDNHPGNLEVWTTPHPAGQRPEDLVDWVLEYYPDLVRARIG